MTLQQITKELEKTLSELVTSIRELEKLEEQYNVTYRDLFLSSQRHTEAQREAGAKQLMRIDHADLTTQYLTKRLDVRCLLLQKDIQMEISKNVRALEYGKGGEKNEQER